MKDVFYFPKNYQDSRERFINAAKVIEGPKITEKWTIPSKVHEDLYVDYLWLPALKKQKRLFVLTSGIHGSETYAGSAIQQMFMEEILPQIIRDEVGILIVHSLNPYGFKNHQRCTENKVNLNRNFSVSGEMYAHDNTESIALHEKFFPTGPVESNESLLLKSLSKSKSHAKDGDVTLDHFTKKVSPGQFKDSKYLEYGGKSLEPQSQYFVELLKKIMPDFDDIIGLDLHTGLGDRGRLHMLTGGEKKQLSQSLFAEIFYPEEDNEFYVFTPPDTEGFYEVHGAINSAFADLANDNQRVCAVTMEFGTLGHTPEAQLAGLNNFLLQHQGSFHGYSSESLKNEIENASFLRSYPSEDDWKVSVIKASRGTFQRLLQRTGDHKKL